MLWYSNGTDKYGPQRITKEEVENIQKMVCRCACMVKFSSQPSDGTTVAAAAAVFYPYGRFPSSLTPS